MPQPEHVLIASFPQTLQSGSAFKAEEGAEAEVEAAAVGGGVGGGEVTWRSAAVTDATRNISSSSKDGDGALAAPALFFPPLFLLFFGMEVVCGRFRRTDRSRWLALPLLIAATTSPDRATSEDGV